jgi:arylsulfatase A-like enzyme
MLKKKPNVILITTDQQRKDSLGCYGSDFVDTPHLDQMAKDGVLFNRAYCTNPVCTPSRVSIYSGRIVSNHGAYNVGTKVSEEEVLVPHIFKANGYRTHQVGKLHFQPNHGSPDISKETRGDGWEKNFDDFPTPYYGFDGVELATGHTLVGLTGHYGLWVREQSGQKEFPERTKVATRFGLEAHDWDIPLELHNSKWTADRTLAFLEEASQDEQPFFLSIGFEDPHHPNAVPTEKAKTIQTERIPLPHYTEGELDDKPYYFKDIHLGKWDENHPLHGEYSLAGQGKWGSDFSQVRSEDAREARAYYYAMVELIDDAMGRILNALDEYQLANDTIVIFTTDHGELLGDHGLWMKGPFHYEQLINIPLIMQWKGHMNQHKVGSIVSLVDLAPTLVELCGLEHASSMDGKDLSPLIYNQADEVRQHALVEYADDPQKLRLKTIVTERYKLTFHYADYGKNVGELYDLKQDPHETQNLWHEPSVQDIKFELITVLLRELESNETRNPRIAYA